MTNDLLLQRAKVLKLHGTVAHWEEITEKELKGLIERLITWEEAERSYRSLQRRLRSSHVGNFK